MNARHFTATVNDKEVELSVISPSLKDRKEADKVYNSAFTEALQAKAVVRARLDDLLVDQGLWDEAKQQKFDTLQKQMLDNEKVLAKGGVSLKRAKEVALEMKKVRAEIRDLISVKTNLDVHTAEGQADNAKFNYLVYACTVHKNTNNKFFASHDDYLDRSTEAASVLAAQNLANMIYGLDADYEYKLPENKFLKQYKFVDEKLRLVNKEGKLVDSKGRLIDENGRFINEEGKFVDKFGNIIKEDGEYDVEFSPFLDDEGNPVVSDEELAVPENTVSDEVETSDVVETLQVANPTENQTLTSESD
jgi:hypothetical protein